MSLRLPDHWVWDSWSVVHEGYRHLFFLRASRALQDPARRHRRASVGHARSRDLRSWELLPDALVHADSPAWDDLATWTGSVVRGDDGNWRMFYTGISRAEDGLVQRVGAAVSPDLITWHRRADALVEADARWYEQLDLTMWSDLSWRDPYVFRDPAGDPWHMLVSARSAEGEPDGRGVVGHATSTDLETWVVQPPLTEPAGFGELEVCQTALVDGHPVLMFSCWPHRAAASRRRDWTHGGIWVARGDSLLGPWDLEGAERLDHPSLYAGRLVQTDAGRWAVLGFRDMEGGVFVGEIDDPHPVEVHRGIVRLRR